MRANAGMTGFIAPMTVGGGFADARQRRPALHAETHAQLMAKHAQKKHLGRGRAICGADHADVTRAAISKAAGVDSKILRWIAESGRDGSEMRSLAGRSARLADGLSRNPGSRGQLAGERTKELADKTGKVRNFNLRHYFSEGARLSRGAGSWRRRLHPRSRCGRRSGPARARRHAPDIAGAAGSSLRPWRNRAWSGQLSDRRRRARRDQLAHRRVEGRPCARLSGARAGWSSEGAPATSPCLLHPEGGRPTMPYRPFQTSESTSHLGVPRRRTLPADDRGQSAQAELARGRR